MDGRRVGRLIRAVRQELGWRQVDLSAAAGVSQKVVSRAELGRLDEITFSSLTRITGALDISVTITATWHGGAGDRLVDREHASIVEVVAKVLVEEGWTIVPEYTFNHYGDRGSVDLLAWHAPSATLLIVEVKTRLFNLQDLLARVATKVRVVPGIVARDRGWDVRHVGRLIVLPGTTGNRAVVARHLASFDAQFPARAVEIRRWLAAPTASLGGIWFLASRHATVKRPLRVRNARPAPLPRTRAAPQPPSQSPRDQGNNGNGAPIA